MGYRPYAIACLVCCRGEKFFAPTVQVSTETALLAGSMTSRFHDFDGFNNVENIVVRLLKNREENSGNALHALVCFMWCADIGGRGGQMQRVGDPVAIVDGGSDGIQFVGEFLETWGCG